MTEEDTTTFKVCTMCEHRWDTRESFMRDLKLVLNWYQADFEDLEHGLFMFTHDKPECESTLAMFADDFIDLNNNPRHPRRKTGTKECPGYCLKADNLAICDQECECVYIRELIEIINQRKKHQ